MRKGPIDELKADLADRTKRHASAVKAMKASEKVKRSADDKANSANSALAYAKDPARLTPFETALAKAEASVLTATERLNKAGADADSIENERKRARAVRDVRAAERTLKDAHAQVARAARELAAAKLPERYKKQDIAAEKAAKDAAAATQKYDATVALVQSTDQALQLAKKELADATTTLDQAVAAATDAKRKTLPVSLFVSRKTQRIYLRQGHEPIADYPIAIAEPDRPIGTHVFTAVDYEAGANNLRWTAVNMARRSGRDVAELSDRSRKKRDDGAIPFPTDAGVAAAALDRLTMPPELLQRVSANVWPGSSLIVSDEAMHKETSNATDFIIVMSGEPQGGIKRRPKPAPVPPPNKYYYEDGWGSNGNYNVAYDRYGRRIKVQKKPLFSWW